MEALESKLGFLHGFFSLITGKSGRVVGFLSCGDGAFERTQSCSNIFFKFLLGGIGGINSFLAISLDHFVDAVIEGASLVSKGITRVSGSQFEGLHRDTNLFGIILKILARKVAKFAFGKVLVRGSVTLEGACESSVGLGGRCESESLQVVRERLSPGHLLRHPTLVGRVQAHLCGESASFNIHILALLEARQGSRHELILRTESLLCFVVGSLQGGLLGCGGELKGACGIKLFVVVLIKLFASVSPLLEQTVNG